MVSAPHFIASDRFPLGGIDDLIRAGWAFVFLEGYVARNRALGAEWRYNDIGQLVAAILVGDIEGGDTMHG